MNPQSEGEITPGAISSHRRGLPTHRVPLWLRIVLTVAVLVPVLWFFVIPQFSDAEESFEAVKDVSPWLIAGALLLQVLSLVSYSSLSGTVLGWGKLRFRTLLRIDLSDLALNHTLPGGGATAAVARFRFLTAEGIPPKRALSVAAVQVAISNVALTMVFGAGIVLALAQIQGDTSNYVLAGVVVVVLVGSLVGAAWLLMARTEGVARFAAVLEHRFPFVGNRLSGLVRSIAGDLCTLGHDRRRLVLAVLFALGNWIFDAASLWVMLAAFGHQLALGPLLTVYGVASIIALLPLTPGGIGLVEGITVPALVGFGVPQSAALLGVIGWRVFEYWLPIPVGAGAYVSLRLSRHRRAALKHRAAKSNPPRTEHDRSLRNPS